MHIEEIIIDGFKSYATRTVISGFDPFFNAITGFNGSGKSNVLDAICFVLGITNLAQVRAGNLQELVYKQGQAGITKASVTILFNNQDAKTSPVGYEQYNQISVSRQVIIGGRHKYTINGHTVQVNQVQNLFHSVQLNVNSPHFLIMQGRITKVLNMKPHEILLMIEEAAGTRMYETKKQAAVRTMSRKDKKLQEINTILIDEITPTLENLRHEKKEYMQWASNNTELERLNRFCIAYEYSKAMEVLESAAANVASIDKALKRSNDLIEKYQSKLDKIACHVQQIENEKMEEGGPKFAKLKKKVDKLDKQAAKLRAQSQHAHSLVEAKELIQKTAHDQKKEVENSISELKERQIVKQSELLALRTDFDTKDKTKTELEEQLQLVNSGGSNSTAEIYTSLNGRLAETQNRLQEKGTALQQLDLKIVHLSERCKQQLQSLSVSKRDNEELFQEQALKQEELAYIMKNIHSVTKRFSPEEEAKLRVEIKDLRDEISRQEQQLDEISSNLSSRLHFKYTDPYSGFDRGNVKGVLAKLVETKDDWSALALEIVAGGKLYQIVVDNEKTAKDILKHGRLMNRVTIIPLNRISGRRVESSKVRKAHEVARQMNGKIWEALELIHFDRSMKPAMEYAFGGSIICETSEIAKKVTFHRDIKVRTVTLDGDSFDPAGTLQGGSAPTTGAPMLMKLHQLMQTSRALSDRKREYNEKIARLDDLRDDAERYRSLQTQIDLKNHELKLLQDRISQSAHAQQERELLELQKCLETDRQARRDIDSSCQDLKAQALSLETEINGLKKSRKSRLGDLEKRVKASTSEATNAGKLYKMAKQELAELELELQSLKEEVVSIIGTIDTHDTDKRKLERNAQDKREQQQAAENAHQQAFNQWEARRTIMKQCDQKLHALSLKEVKLIQKKEDKKLEIKKLEHKKQRLARGKEDSYETIHNLEEKHVWIQKEKEYFGREHTDYDFEREDSEKVMHRMQELRSAQDALSKKINKKVMGMIENAESEYQNLITKRQTLENDKQKITTVIEELDTKKNEALQTTWRVVNKDFGSIFSTLLPGTTAKLEPLSSGAEAALDGLQVSVAFNGVWKESLTELSGGQRSLLALSLILSLLLFKPAPMYILDEVDAALDLSHTQNIGQMIRKHFSHSQFIVVSLKEGMFNNANVLFRTKFIDGVSTIHRTTSSTGRQ